MIGFRFSTLKTEQFVKIFHKNFCSRRRSILERKMAKNGRFGLSSNPHPMKNLDEKRENLHIIPAFVHVFCLNFATLRVFVSTQKNKKSTPNFSAALTFFSQRTPFFAKASSNSWFSMVWQNPSKFAFFRQNVLSRRIFEFWRGNMAVLSISFVKIVSWFGLV